VTFRYKQTARQLAVAFAGIALASLAGAYDLQKAAQETGLSPVLIRAIAHEESRRLDARDGMVRPWPWTLNVQGEGMFFQTRREAERALAHYYRQGIRNIDVGVFQINIRWNGDLAERPEDLLDPRVNLWAFAQVIRECRMRSGREFRDIIACYHAGSAHRERGQAYASRVINRYKSLRAEAR